MTGLSRRTTKQRENQSRSRSRGLRRLRREDGQAFVEFVLVAPILFILIFAIFQFGIAFYDWIALTRAVSAGGRAAAVCNFNPGTDIPTVVKSAASNLDQSSLTASWSGCQASGGEVSVTGTYPFNITIPFIGTINPVTANPAK